MFNRITCSQYSNMFTHSSILHDVKKSLKKSIRVLTEFDILLLLLRAVITFLVDWA